MGWAKRRREKKSVGQVSSLEEPDDRRWKEGDSMLTRLTSSTSRDSRKSVTE